MENFLEEVALLLRPRFGEAIGMRKPERSSPDRGNPVAQALGRRALGPLGKTSVAGG